MSTIPNESILITLPKKLYTSLNYANISNHEFAFIILFLASYFLFIKYKTKWIITEMYIKTLSELNLKNNN